MARCDQILEPVELRSLLDFVFHRSVDLNLERLAAEKPLEFSLFEVIILLYIHGFKVFLGFVVSELHLEVVAERVRELCLGERAVAVAVDLLEEMVHETALLEARSLLVHGHQPLHP